MTVIDDPFEPTDPSDAALDRLLAQARWPKPSVDVELRLRERWEGLNRKRRWVVPVYAVAAAATIMVAVGTILFLQGHATLVTVAPIQREMPDVKYFMIPSGTANPTPYVESRPATVLEQLALLQASLGPVVEADSRPSQPREPQAAPEIVELTEQLGDMNVERRFSAAQELAEMDDPNVVAVLARMVRQGINVREALLALKLSQNPQAADALAQLPLSRANLAQLAADERMLQPGS